MILASFFIARAQGKCHRIFVGAIVNEMEPKMQSAKSESAARVLWVVSVVVPLVCVAMCGTLTPFMLASIFLILTSVQALKMSAFSRTSTLEGVSYSAVRARDTFKHLLLVFLVCALLLLTLGSSFRGGINLLRHGSLYVNTNYVNTKNSR